jgi:hypothetical protein
MRLKGDRWEYYLDGRPVTEEEYYQRYPAPESRAGDVPGGTSTKGWPMVSVALAVHPDQVAEANERNKRHGVHARYRPDGKCVIPDAADRKRLLKVEGFFDRDGYN